jgi:hypothetical protein
MVDKVVHNRDIRRGDVPQLYHDDGNGTFSPVVSSAWESCSLGVSGAAVVSSDMTQAVAVTDVPGLGKKLVIQDILVSTDTPTSVTFTEETTGLVIFKVYLPANGSGQITTRGKLKLSTVNTRLMAVEGTKSNIAITCLYISEA